jgi:hypothetical protein
MILPATPSRTYSSRAETAHAKRNTDEMSKMTKNIAMR